MKTVTIYTDGACSGNPGPGGWGTVLMFGEHKKEISGFMPDTTNNRMELFAAVQGFTALKQPCAVTLYSDSAYLVNAFKQNWIDGWQCFQIRHILLVLADNQRTYPLKRKIKIFGNGC